VIIGGEDHKTGQEEETETRYERLEKILKENFPSAKPRHRWSGQVIETPDGLPYIGTENARCFPPSVRIWVASWRGMTPKKLGTVRVTAPVSLPLANSSPVLPNPGSSQSEMPGFPRRMLR
jgi:hypothetical protein